MTLANVLAVPAQTGLDPAADYEGFIGWVLNLMTSLGEVGVGLALLIETFFPPMPSEAVLPGAGFLAYDGQMNVWLAILAASLGALVGAWGWYAVGAAFGRERTLWIVSKTPLLEVEDFTKAERFFQRWGGLAVLLGRCVPIVRSFISIPAGIERMGLVRFSAYTMAGSLIWNSIWVGLGYLFGPAIKPILEEFSGILSYAALGIIALLCLWFVIVRLRRIARKKAEAPNPLDEHPTRRS